jgi:hypothetical protein
METLLRFYRRWRQRAVVLVLIDRRNMFLAMPLRGMIHLWQWLVIDLRGLIVLRRRSHIASAKTVLDLWGARSRGEENIH